MRYAYIGCFMLNINSNAYVCICMPFTYVRALQLEQRCTSLGFYKLALTRFLYNCQILRILDKFMLNLIKYKFSVRKIKIFGYITIIAIKLKNI